MGSKLNHSERLDHRVRESADLSAGIIGSAMDAIIAVDDAQRIVLFNAAAERIFACPANDAIGSSVERFIPQRFRAAHRRRVRRFAESGVANRTFQGLATLWGRRATGEEFPIEASISKAESAGKKFLTAVIRDITERIRSEEALRKSEERFHLAALAGRMFAYEWDATTDVIVRSPEFVQVLGDEPLETTGQQIMARIHPDHRERVKAAVAALTPENPLLRISYRMARRDGTFIWLERTSRAHFDEQGRMLRLVGMVADATERRHAEEALKESEQRFRSVADSAPVLIWMSGVDKLCTYFNKPWLDFTGRSIEHELGNGWAEGVHPDDLQRCLNTYIQSFDKREKFRMEYRLRHHDGEYRWILDIGVPRFNQDGEFVGYIGIGVDVTDRKRAEDSLGASEERLRLAQQAARIGSFEWNTKTGVNTWTPELEAMYGLPRGGFGGTQTAFENLVHPDDRERVIELDDWALKTGQPTTGEWRVVWADGSVHWIAGRWQVYMDESGQPSRMVGINIDITERRRAEEELATANERLHLAIDSGSVGGWDFDLKTDRSVWFGKSHAQLGMTPGDTLGSRKEFWDRVHEDDRERLRHAMRVAKGKHEEFTVEFRVVWRDGSTHWLRSRGRYYYSASGEAERMLGISIDITESKQAEEALLRYAAIVESSDDGISSVTLDGVTLTWNAGAQRMFGYTEHDMVGKSASIIVPPELRDQQKKILETLRAGGRIEQFETVRVSKMGKRIDVSLSISPVKDSTGKIVGCAGIGRDITTRKRSEEALADMTRKLIEAQEQERARIGRELHDDINQRLAMLSVEVEQLRENPSEVQVRLGELRKQIGEISNDVQALSHDLHSSKLEYLGVIAGIRSWCKEFGERQRVETDFSSDVRSALPFETGLSLFRVLQEALHNATKHSGAKRIEVQLREDSGEIYLIVRDLGKGFDVEAALQGRGLGLTSMRERVRLVNGTISIESKPMGGTTIHVRVPLAPRHDTQRAAG